MRDVRRRLDDLKLAARGGSRPRAAARSTAPASLAEIIGGHEAECDGQRYWLVETPFDRICADAAARPEDFVTARGAVGGSDNAQVIARRAMVVDIETGGFAGTPVFLIGIVPLDCRPLRVLQLLARDYPEEEAILRAMARHAAERDIWVTFNGKSFDEPFLRDRATLHRVTLPPTNVHVDVLHAARRRWRHELPNCRLGTLEAHILTRPRVGDVPSSDVPDLFHHFIRTGNANPLRPVLEHNRIDLVSSTELLVRLSEPVT